MRKKKINGVPFIKVSVVLLLFVISFCFAMFQGGFVSWFIFFAVVPFLIYSMLLVFIPIKINDIHRFIQPGYVVRGNRINVTLTFINRTRFPLIFMAAREKMNNEDLVAKMEVHSTNLFLVGFKRNFEWQYEIRNVSRGEIKFEGLEITITDFFGWIERTVIFEKKERLLVYPKVSFIPNEQLLLQYDQGNAQTNRALIKDSNVAIGIRKYVAGDRFSWIHWKSFAKSGELRTKEFENIQAQHIVLYLDRGLQEDFEAVVDLTASLLNGFVKQNAEISFFTVGQERKLFPSIKTASQYEAALQYLAITQMERHSILLKHAIQTEHQFMQQAIVCVVTSRYGEELEQLLLSGSKYARAIVCFVVLSEEKFASIQHGKTYAGQNQAIYLTEKMFSQALAEVRG